MNVVFRHAWMQKHPTPTNARGDFHWHPDGVPAAIRGTLADLATRVRGQATSVWALDTSYVAWARTFSAVSPADQRRYTGLVVTLFQDGGAGFGDALPRVLARMPLPAAGPFAGQAHTQTARLDDAGALAGPAQAATRPLALDAHSLTSLFAGGDRDLAAAVYLGGPVQSRDPHAERLPALMGRLLTWLPARERVRPRTGMFAPGRGGMETRSHAEPMDNLLHYLAAAWFCPEPIRQRAPGFAADAWQLVLDLAASCSLSDAFAELTRVASAWDTAANLQRYLLEGGALAQRDIAACDRAAPRPLCASTVADAGRLWSRILHYWGRGFLPADSLPRLAAVLARRIAVDHLFHLDAPEQRGLPRRYLRRLAYEALLTRQRVAAMTRAIQGVLPSLTLPSPSREVPLV